MLQNQRLDLQELAGLVGSGLLYFSDNFLRQVKRNGMKELDLLLLTGFLLRDYLRDGDLF